MYNVGNGINKGVKYMDYRLQINIPLELEELASKKAYSLGLIRGGKGIVGLYIAQLIFKDLDLRDINSFNNYNIVKEYSDTKRINIPIPRERLNELENRARELGFISERSNKPIITKYIIHLLKNEKRKDDI